MNILQVINSLDCGGLEKLTLNLAKGLKTQGHNVVICCLEGLGNLHKGDLGGIEVAALNKKDGLDVILPFRLAGLMRKEKIEIIHSHNPGPLIYGTIAGKIAGVPVIINTRHGRAPRQINRFIWEMNDCIVSISNDAKTELVKINKINPEKVTVIHNGIDLKEFNSTYQSYPEEKKKIGLEASFVIGTVSRLSPEKDQTTLIKAFAKVAAVETTAKLVFVGDGPSKNVLQALAKSLGLEDRVIFLGFRSDISVIMRSFDIFVLSSLMEGISLSLLEAMALSRPVVVTDVGGNPEVVKNNETGILALPQNPDNLAEGIISLAKNRDMANKFGEAGRKWVEQEFDIDKMVARYLSLYEKCLGSKK